MSQVELDRFMGDVRRNSELREKIRSFSDDPGGAVAYAQSLGYDITLDDRASTGGELSDDDLDHVAGGGCQTAETCQLCTGHL